MKRILLAVLAVAWFHVAVRAEENDVPEVTLANLKMESHEIVATTDAGDLLRTTWNLKGVEAVPKNWNDHTGFRRSPPATDSAKLELQIATGAWAKRMNISERQDFGINCFGMASYNDSPPSPPFEMNWLTDDFWPLTRSYVRQDTDHNAQIHNAQITSFDY